MLYGSRCNKMKKRKDYTRKIIICGYQDLLCTEPVKKLSKPILEFNKVLRYFKIMFFLLSSNNKKIRWWKSIYTLR